MNAPSKPVKSVRDGADVIVDYLIREKVPYIFGLCGHGNIGFIDALPYNPDFAAMARAAGIAGVSVGRASELADAVRDGIASGKPYVIDANVDGDLNPAGAGIWELPGMDRSKPGIGKQYVP